MPHVSVWMRLRLSQQINASPTPKQTINYWFGKSFGIRRAYKMIETQSRKTSTGARWPTSVPTGSFRNCHCISNACRFAFSAATFCSAT
jgi:hypothetical protein